MSLDSESQDELRSRVPTDGDWRAIAQMVSDLPPLPHVAIQAMRLMENPHVTTSQISELISHDTALAARLLKISNSAMFARRAKITTLSQAILMVGFKTLKGIILAATLRGMNRQESAMEGLTLGLPALTRRVPRAVPLVDLWLDTLRQDPGKFADIAREFDIAIDLSVPLPGFIIKRTIKGGVETATEGLRKQVLKVIKG